MRRRAGIQVRRRRRRRQRLGEATLTTALYRLQGLQSDSAARNSYKTLGESVGKVRIEHLREQLAKFRSRLEAFALEHRAAIARDPVFRAHFHAMCGATGVDPLASNKGVWAHVLGFGDFYYELAVQVVEACMAARAHTGGLLELSALHAAVSRRRGAAAAPVSADDILRAVAELARLGGGYGLETAGGRTMVRSVPGALSPDTADAVAVAAGGGTGAGSGRGWVTVSGLAAARSWPAARATTALESLLREGLALADDGARDGARRYYLPCIDGGGG